MVTPEQIKNDISSRPPLQRDEAGKYYQDIKVNWQLKFRQCFYPDSNNKSLLTIHGMSRNADVALQVNPNKYPELKLLYAGETFKVRGVISEVQNGYLIVLKDVHLDFGSNKEPKTKNKIETNSLITSVKTGGDFVARNKFEQVKNKNPIIIGHSKEKEWYESWWGIIIIGVIIVLLGAFLTNFFGLTN